MNWSIVAANARIARVRRWLAVPEHCAFAGAWALLTTLTLVLIWLPAFLPFADEAVVAYSGVAYHGLQQGDSFWQLWYEPRPGAFSHVLFYHAVHWLLYLMGPAVAMKLLTSACALATPAALLFLFRSMGRSHWLALAGFGVSFNGMLAMGYLPFLASLPLWLSTLALIEHNRREQRLWRLVLFALLVAVSPLFHFMTGLIMLLTVPLWCVLALRSGRHLGVHAFALTLAAAPATWLMTRRVSGTPVDWERAFGPLDSSRRVQELHQVLGFTTNGLDAWSLPLLVGACVCVLVLTQGRETHTDTGLRSFRLELCILVLALGYMVGPWHIGWPWPAWDISERFATCILLLLPGLPRFVPRDLRQSVLLVPPLLFSIFHLLALFPVFRAYGRATEPLLEISRRIPAESKLLALSLDDSTLPGSPAFGRFLVHTNRHLPKYAAAISGSFQPESFCVGDYHPLACRQQLAFPRDLQARSACPALRAYDAVVLFSSAASVPESLKFAVSSCGFVLGLQQGSWLLWRRTGAE